MSSERKRKALFLKHAEDLSKYFLSESPQFICPICLERFSLEQLRKGLIDIGHVWPQYFRDTNRNLKNQEVLLCKDCNSSAGSAGDKIMQEVARTLEIHESGVLGLRKVRVIKSSDPTRFVDLELHINQLDERSGSISFPKYGKASQKEYFQGQWEKFGKMADEGLVNIMAFGTRGNPCRPFGDPKRPALAQAGFLTSAYLFMFFRYGYVFILQTCLDPVRSYIRDSFQRNVDKRLSYAPEKAMSVNFRQDSIDYFEEPISGLVLARNHSIPVFHEIRFRDFQIRLPAPHENGMQERAALLASFLAVELDSVNNLPSEAAFFVENMSATSFDLVANFQDANSSAIIYCHLQEELSRSEAH